MEREINFELEGEEEPQAEFVETPECIAAVREAIRQADENPEEGLTPDEFEEEMEKWFAEWS